MRHYWYLWILFFILIFPLQAQETALVPTASPYTVTANRQAPVFSGPDISYRQVGILAAGTSAEVIERNHIGNWLHLRRYETSANRVQILMDAWVMTGYLSLSPNLHFSQVRIADLADYNPAGVSNQSHAELYELPTIPQLAPEMREVFERGQAMGNNPRAITKIGDSLSVSDGYMSIFRVPSYKLGAYDYLEEAFLYYRDAVPNLSIAARIGMSSYGIFDPFWSDPYVCQAGETPLDCEFRLHKPSVAFILFGANDVRVMTAERYREQMRQLVEETLAAGVIPVLMTFSTHPDEAFYEQSLTFNLEVVRIAADYHVPLINLWAAAQALPQHGLEADLVHLTHNGFGFLKFDTGHEAFYGVSLQNLLVLCTLYEIYDTLDLGVRNNAAS